MRWLHIESNILSVGSRGRLAASKLCTAYISKADIVEPVYPKYCSLSLCVMVTTSVDWISLERDRSGSHTYFAQHTLVCTGSIHPQQNMLLRNAHTDRNRQGHPYRQATPQGNYPPNHLIHPHRLCPTTVVRLRPCLTLSHGTYHTQCASPNHDHARLDGARS